MPVNATVYTLEPVTILFINPHKDLQLTLSGTINLDTSAGRPYAENVPADVTVDVESSEPPGAPFLPYYSDVITTAGDKLDGESISLLGPPNAQLFVSIPLFSYPCPLNFTGTMLVIAEPSSALNVFDGDTTQVTFVASPSIPEPPSLLLLAGGFGFLALRRALAGVWLRPSWGGGPANRVGLGSRFYSDGDATERPAIPSTCKGRRMCFGPG
jgi:hypothetical protein